MQQKQIEQQQQLLQQQQELLRQQQQQLQQLQRPQQRDGEFNQQHSLTHVNLVSHVDDLPISEQYDGIPRSSTTTTTTTTTMSSHQGAHPDVSSALGENENSRCTKVLGELSKDTVDELMNYYDVERLHAVAAGADRLKTTHGGVGVVARSYALV